MSRLLLVRHGETVWHRENRYAGNTDIALTAKGREQADRLGQWAATAGLTALWSSPLVRARDTIEPAVRSTGLALRIDQRLQELSFGRGEGLTGAEMEQRFPAERAAFSPRPGRRFPCPGAKTRRLRHGAVWLHWSALRRRPPAAAAWSSPTARCFAWCCAACSSFHCPCIVTGSLALAMGQ